MIAIEKLQGTYLTDILDQPRALRDTVGAFRHVPELDRIATDLRQGNLRSVVLTGMGGSYQILYPLHLLLIRSGLNSLMVETSELLHSMPELLNDRNVVVTVSQSGASAETVRLIEKRGPRYIGLTNTADSPLARGTGVAVLTKAGEEGGVACKTAVSLLAALRWVGQHLTQVDVARERQVLETAAVAVETYLAGWREHVEALVQGLAGIKRAFIVGRGASLAAAGLGAMVQKEAAHFHAEGISSAALRHGPFEMLDSDCFVLIFEGSTNVSELHHRLLRDVLDTGAKASLCGSGVTDGPFSLPASDDAVRPILELMPTQMISLALSYLRGREPGKFERITKITTVE